MYTKQQAMKISNDIVATLQDYAAKNNIKIEFGGGKLGDKLVLKLNISTGDPAAAEAEARESFRSNCWVAGLKAEDFGRQFRTHSGVYQVNAVDPRKPKYPILATRVGDGKRFKFHPSQVTRNWVSTTSTKHQRSA